VPRISAKDVYAAEHSFEFALNNRHLYPTAVVFGSTINVPDQRRFGQIDHVTKYIDYVLAHPTIRQLFPERSMTPVSVRVRKGQNRAHYEERTAVIALPDNKFGLCEVTVLHELTHHLVPGGQHDRDFINAFDTLVGSIMGSEAVLLYRDCVANLTALTT
jgi:putative metallohydrolase (TIGR04338 family)